MDKVKKALLKFLLKISTILLSVFALTFVVYFFNLDMKLTSAMEPILFKFYDKVKRDQHL